MTFWRFRSCPSRARGLKFAGWRGRCDVLAALPDFPLHLEAERAVMSVFERFNGEEIET